MSDKPNLPAAQSSVPPPANSAVIEKFLNVQEKEIALKTQEIELKKQSDTNAHDYAKAALAANVEDRKSQRSYEKDYQTHNHFFYGVIIIGFFIFLGWTLHLGKDDIVKEVIKAILYILTSGLGGYGYGRLVQRQSDEKNKN